MLACAQQQAVVMVHASPTYMPWENIICADLASVWCPGGPYQRSKDRPSNMTAHKL